MACTRGWTSSDTARSPILSCPIKRVIWMDVGLSIRNSIIYERRPASPAPSAVLAECRLSLRA